MKYCLILGANSDIGKALAFRFAKEGYNLLLAARNLNEANDRFVTDIGIRFGIKAENLNFDAIDYRSHESFYNALDNKPDVIISVFGYLGTNKTAESDFDEAAKIVNTNFLGQVSILNIIANDLEKRKSGTIIGISSVAGERGRQSNYMYGASKAGFTAYLSGLRNRLFKSNVHVVTVKPGFVRTKMTEGLPLPDKLTASPEQVANAIWKSFVKKKNTIYVLSIWIIIMTIIKSIPEGIFKKLNL